MLQTDHWARPTLQDNTVIQANATDIHGGLFGNSLTVPSNKWFSFGAQGQNMNYNKPIYIEFDIKSKNTNENFNEQINLTCSSRIQATGGQYNERVIYKREIKLTNEFVHYQIKLNLYAPYLNSVWTNASDSTVSLEIQNFVVYASDSPQSIIDYGNFGSFSLHRNAVHNATFRLESDDRISVTFADGTKKYISLNNE